MRRKNPAARPEERTMLGKRRAMLSKKLAPRQLFSGTRGKCMFPLPELVAALSLRRATRESSFAGRESTLASRGKSIFPLSAFLECLPEPPAMLERLRETRGKCIFPLPLRRACL
jgi:hypothetical protein